MRQNYCGSVYLVTPLPLLEFQGPDNIVDQVCKLGHRWGPRHVARRIGPGRLGLGRPQQVTARGTFAPIVHASHCEQRPASRGDVHSHFVDDYSLTF